MSRALRTVGPFLVATALVAAALFREPVSGFWILVVLALPLLARSLRPPQAFHG